MKRKYLTQPTVSVNNVIEAGDEVKLDVKMICREQNVKFKLIPCTQ